MTVGDRVRIERDETLYPSKGAWPQFLGRTGTIIEVNVDRKRPRLTEFGVSFGKVTKALDGHRREFNEMPSMWLGSKPMRWLRSPLCAPLSSSGPLPDSR